MSYPGEFDISRVEFRRPCRYQLCLNDCHSGSDLRYFYFADIESLPRIPLHKGSLSDPMASLIKSEKSDAWLSSLES
jgi:hypothetical protein